MLAIVKISVLAACTVLLAASQASAADLGARSLRIGAIFAEPPHRVTRVEVYQRPNPVFVGTALIVPGYYGQPADFEYRNYYGTSPLAIYGRLPYACGFLGAC